MRGSAYRTPREPFQGINAFGKSRDTAEDSGPCVNSEMGPNSRHGALSLSCLGMIMAAPEPAASALWNAASTQAGGDLEHRTQPLLF